MEEQLYDRALPHLTRHLLRFRTILRRSKTLSEQDKRTVEAKMKSYDSLLDGDVELQKEIQEVIQEGIQKGIQEKIAESERNGLQQGIQQGMQQVILDIVEVRFPSLLEVASNKWFISTIKAS
ncbi:MAG: hypothetical protein NVS4B11_20190 [Ktedonobacteraceae bacterium]